MAVLLIEALSGCIMERCAEAYVARGLMREVQLEMILLVGVYLVVVQVRIKGSGVRVEEVFGLLLVPAFVHRRNQHGLRVILKARLRNSIPTLVCFLASTKHDCLYDGFVAVESTGEVVGIQVTVRAVDKSIGIHTRQTTVDGEVIVE